MLFDVLCKYQIYTFAACSNVVILLLFVQMFCNVFATVHERIPQAVASPTLWQMVVERVMRQCGVDIHDLVIHGSWLQIEMCRLMLMKIYTECLTRDVGNREDHKIATGRTSKTWKKGRGLAVLGDTRRKGRTTMGGSESDGKACNVTVTSVIVLYFHLKHLEIFQVY